MLLGLVADAIQPAGGLVRLDLLGVGQLVELEHQTGLRATLFQLAYRHVLEGVALDLPAGVRRGVDHVQLLRAHLVQQLLRTDQVLDQTHGTAATEVREVGHDREVLVRRPVVVQYHVVGDHGPADPLDQLLGQRQIGVLSHVLLDAHLIPIRRDHARIAGADVDEVQHSVQLPPLPLDDADVPGVVVPGVRPRVVRVHRPGVAEAVAIAVDGVVAVREVAVLTAAQEVCVGLAVQHLYLIGAHPLRDDDVAPLVGVVLIRVGVDKHVLRVQLLDPHLAAQGVGEVQPDVEEPARAHDAVGEHVAADPVELVVVADLHEHLGQGISDLGGGPLVARLEGDVRAVEDLLAHHVRDGADDLVDRQRGAAVALQQGQIVRVPLEPDEEVLADRGFLDEVEVPIVAEPRVAAPDFIGQRGVDGHVVLLTVKGVST